MRHYPSFNNFVREGLGQKDCNRCFPVFCFLLI